MSLPVRLICLCALLLACGAPAAGAAGPAHQVELPVALEQNVSQGREQTSEQPPEHRRPEDSPLIRLPFSRGDQLGTLPPPAPAPAGYRLPTAAPRWFRSFLRARGRRSVFRIQQDATGAVCQRLEFSGRTVRTSTVQVGERRVQLEYELSVDDEPVHVFDTEARRERTLSDQITVWLNGPVYFELREGEFHRAEALRCGAPFAVVGGDEDGVLMMNTMSIVQGYRPEAAFRWYRSEELCNEALSSTEAPPPPC